MERIDTTFVILEGAEVYGSDGEKVGSVIAVQPSYIIVEKGFFFPTDYAIPFSAVANYEDGKVHLNLTKDAALDQGWSAQPSDFDDYDTPGGAFAGLDSRPAVVTMGATDPDLATAAGTATGRDDRVGEQPFEHDSHPDVVSHVHDDDRIRVPVHEEELTATTRERELGEVRVEKDVVAEERTLEVPVTEERVRVERRVVDRPADAADAAAFEEGTIEVPIRGEEVEVQKRVRVAEEVEIGKEAVQRTEQVGGTVRREEVRVSEDVAGHGAAGAGAAEGEAFFDQTTDAVRDPGRGS